MSEGMPLLSGPPPPPDNSGRAEIACRKCNKEFNIIFTRAHRCNHCGYSYCSSCSDFQALIRRNGAGAGYDPVNVCAFCIEYLNITAGGRRKLKTLPLAQLKRYVAAYNIQHNAVEKDDLIDAIINARGPNGCLPVMNEMFYRKYSVPTRGEGIRPRSLFSRDSGPPPSLPPRPRTQDGFTRQFARPDLHQNQSGFNAASRPRPWSPAQSTQQHTFPTTSQPSPPPLRPHTRPASQPAGGTQTSAARPPPPPPHTTRPSPAPSTTTLPTPPSYNVTPDAPGARTVSTAVPLPSLDELLNMTHIGIAALSVGTLKTILFNNHVNARLMLEKEELVIRVQQLLEDERRDRARMRAIQEEEECEMREMRERIERERLRKEQGAEFPEEDVPVKAAPPALAPRTSQERGGLCVICQDEEANIAVVDCGHLSMCRACSELIMASSRECPLCRTRIITEARLLRIFKT
ncbi:hypothetical protein FISHEDRAFT_74678 [Fistulina hepatica ATCC 64428]|uniref:RING-type domain-containing protein n=1 Tax=Fistulina hepatica ATCC 64428 TaxID=1128425 RepID=A0A0D7A9A0_9AGAR|nr:hypothetical protein FISHEDRAFT_74678 [Fistulina hepatica ATCC 64428]